MSLPTSARKRLSVAAFSLFVSGAIMAQSGVSPQGSEYGIVGQIPGDQTHAQLALGPSGGYVVWQDNATDGDGLGIGARRLDGSFSGVLSTFRVNDQTVGDQENPQVALAKDGGAVFVWQGGTNGFSEIYARFLSPSGAFVTGDVRVNTFANGLQHHPAVAVLADGSVVIVWTSTSQDGNQSNGQNDGMDGVFGQRFSAQGAKIGGEFRINVTTLLNQRSPAVSALSDGGFVVAWVSERQGGVVLSTDENGVATDSGSGAIKFDVGIFAGIYDANCLPIKAEFRLDDGVNACADPSLAPASNGGFTAVWSGRAPAPPIVNQGIPTFEGWDIYGRAFDATGSAVRAASRLNTFVYGDQFAPKIAGSQSRQLVVWTSMAQDGSAEGIFQRVISGDDATPVSAEQAVNTVARGPQVYPAVASDGTSHYVAIWSSMSSALVGFDLAAQRYATDDMLPTPGILFVNALSQSKLGVSWPDLAGYPGVQYELYFDSAPSPVLVSSNYWVATQLVAGSTHTVQLAYRLGDGRRSSLSTTFTGKTWGDDETFDGLPDDWQSLYWGHDRSKWPVANVDSDGDGASNIQEFLAGTNPMDATSVLRAGLISTPQGPRLQWNTQAGSIYQVQTTADFSSWVNLGGLRLATGANDSIPVAGGAGSGYYRVVRQR